MRSAKVRFLAFVGLSIAATGCSFSLGTGTGPGPSYGYSNHPPQQQQGGVAVQPGVGGQPQQVPPQHQPILGSVAPPPGRVLTPHPTLGTGHPDFTPQYTPRYVPSGVHLGGVSPATVQLNPQAVPLLHGGVQVVPMIPQNTTFGGNPDGRGALRGVLYFVPVGSKDLPDFSTLTPQGVTYVDQLNVPLEDFNEGFPGAANRYEWFGFRYDGSFTCAATGLYTFHIYSDDGSKVWIDGQQIIDNDGIHLAGPGKIGQVNLKSGAHTIRVDYYQALRWTLQLQLYVTPPNGQMELWAPAI